MKNFYFTFGQTHRHKAGQFLKDHWVRVAAEDYESARTKFVSDFADKELPSPMQFAFQYEEDRFNKEIYPGGEFRFIK